MSKKLLLTLMTAAAITITGCGQTTTNEGTGAVNTEAPVNTEASATPEEGQEAATVKVVHALGETEVPKNPKNIVVLELGILDALDALEITPAGLPLSGSLPSYLAHLEDESLYTNVGSLKELDMEKIYEIEPELIIIGGRQADYYEELSKIAPTVNLAVDNADYLTSFETNINYLGEIFGKEEEVTAKVKEIKDAVAEVSAKAAEKDVNALIALANGDAFSVYGKGSRFGIIHNEFGIKPVDETIEVSTHGQNASFEYILEQNPDYLFVVDRSAVVAGEGSAPALFDNELIKKTAASENDRIIYLDPTVWYTAGGGFTSTMTMVNEIAAAIEK